MTTENPKLSAVTTIVKELRGFKAVELHWIYDGQRPQRRSYAELIENYDPVDYGARSFVDELFTADEARQLKDYLDQSNQGTTTISDVDFPIPNNLVGYMATGVGGPTGFLMITKYPYPLPFKVLGYYDLTLATALTEDIEVAK
jgi:hypothetical protein